MINKLLSVFLPFKSTSLIVVIPTKEILHYSNKLKILCIRYLNSIHIIPTKFKKKKLMLLLLCLEESRYVNSINFVLHIRFVVLDQGV